MRELCAVVGADDESLAEAIAAQRRRVNGSDPAGGRRRVYVTGSAHAETLLAAAVEAAGATIVEGSPVQADDGLPPVEAIARRLEHPLLARARASSVERARGDRGGRGRRRRRRRPRLLPRARRRAALGVPGAAGGARAARRSR